MLNTLIVLSLLGIIVLLVMTVVSAIRKTKKVKMLLIGAGICLLVLIIAAANAPANVASPDPNKKFISAKIVKVVDGDTMDVSFKDGDKDKKETIRLLLVDTPETVAPGKPIQPFGPEASAFAKETLSGNDVKLEIDVSERDKYGRLLCYLYVGDRMFNEMLLEKGLARVAYIYPPNIKYVDQFKNIQKKSQLSGAGIWSIENYAQEDGFHAEALASKNNPKSSVPKETNNVSYKNCTEVKAAGKAPLHRGEPGYSSKLDQNNDGIACE
jgi:micrococcal nuclease